MATGDEAMTGPRLVNLTVFACNGCEHHSAELLRDETWTHRCKYPGEFWKYAKPPASGVFIGVAGEIVAAPQWCPEKPK